MKSVETVLTNISALVIGHVTHDTYGKDMVPGGCAYYAATAIRELGGASHLLSAWGKGFKGTDVLEGVRVSSVIGEHTTEFTNIYPKGKPRIQYANHQASEIRIGQLPDNWSNWDLLLLAPVMGEINLTDWANHGNKGHTAVMLQGYLKKKSNGISSDGTLVVPTNTLLKNSQLDCLDSVFLSSEDIQLFGYPGLLEQLRALVPLVVVTHGQQGSTLYQGKHSIDIGIYPTHCVDPTGAGDTFAAVMAAGLAAGLKPVNAARLGAAAASVIIEGRAGEAINRLKQAFDRVEQIFPVASF